MCMLWKPGESAPPATVSTVTVAYPLEKSTVASATCLPSAVFSWVVRDWAPAALDDVVDVDALSEDWFEQPPIATTGRASTARVELTCLIMNRAYPGGDRHKPRNSQSITSCGRCPRRARPSISRSGPRRYTPIRSATLLVAEILAERLPYLTGRKLFPISDGN